MWFHRVWAHRYIVPTSLYSSLNITDNLIHTWIASGGPDMFDLGQKFLENAYSAYDSAYILLLSHLCSMQLTDTSHRVQWKTTVSAIIPFPANLTFDGMSVH